MTDVTWNQKVKEALDRTEFMALSTVTDAQSWISPIAFAYNETMDLFFISMIDSRHSQNILANPDVSAAIFKTERFPGGDVLGIQLRGIAHHLMQPSDIAEAAKYYFGRSPSNDEFREETSEKGGADASWQFFRIRPTEVWCFDSRIFGERREQVDLKSIHLKLD